MADVHLEKSPRKNSGKGTVNTPGVDPCRRRKLSMEKKIKVRFFRIGPPIVPPNSFCLVGAFVAAKNQRASNFSLRKNSKALPCRPLVPRFSVKLVTPATACPYSAE